MSSTEEKDLSHKGLVPFHNANDKDLLARSFSQNEIGALKGESVFTQNLALRYARLEDKFIDLNDRVESLESLSGGTFRSYT
jgi:uncharacterized protein YbgA (DUF1722 family)